MKIARITLSDRAAGGIYPDASGPEIENVIQQLFSDDIEWHRALLPDERAGIEQALRHFADDVRCPLILTTGGTGPQRAT